MLIGMGRKMSFEEVERARNILGVSKDASYDEILRAWRPKSRKYHPDKNPGDKAAEEKFKVAQWAYYILGEEAQRKINAGDVSNHSSQVSETESLNKLDSGESMYLRLIRDNNSTLLGRFFPTITLHFMDPLQGVDEELTFQWSWAWIQVKYSDGSYFPIRPQTAEALRAWHRWFRGLRYTGFSAPLPFISAGGNEMRPDRHATGGTHRYGEIVFPNGASYFVYLRTGFSSFYAINIQDKPNLSLPQIRTKWWLRHNKRRFRHRYAREASR